MSKVLAFSNLVITNFSNDLLIFLYILLALVIELL